MLNRIVIVGRLCADPTLRHTQGGTPISSFTLAVDRDFKNPNGEQDTDFIEVIAENIYVCDSMKKQPQKQAAYSVSALMGGRQDGN